MKVRAISRALGIELYYEPESMAETQRRADEVIANVGVQTAINRALSGKTNAADMAVVYRELARLSSLFDHYRQNGRMAEASAVADAYAGLLGRVAEHQIETGRVINIAKTLTSALRFVSARRKRFFDGVGGREARPLGPAY